MHIVDLSGEYKEDDAPLLPLDEDNNEDEYDLQKELEAKFDELFGPIDDNDSNDNNSNE